MTRATCCTQIAVATADSAVRVRLIAALRSEPGFRVVGDASDEIQLLTLRAELRPDILLLDSALAGAGTGLAGSW